MNISTNSGDLSITQPISSTAASADSVLLYADKDAAAGAAGDGDIKISGSGTVSIDATSRAGLYSGTRANSTGLVTLVGEANVRTNVAGTTALASVTPSVGSTGLFALFRSTAATSPGAPGAVSASSVAGSREATLSWSAPTVTGGAAITGYKIEINDGSGWTTQTANTGSSATTATISDLVIGTSYQFRVSAINSAGTSSASAASTSLTILDFPPPAPYTGPLLTNLTLLPLVAGESETVTLSGARLDTVISATVDELKLTIISKSESQLVVLVPGLKAGIKDLVLVSSSGNLTHQDAFKVGETEPEIVSETGNQKVNAGSFKGYVAIYAKGYEGQRLSAKVGNDWVIVPSIVNNQENGSLFRIVEFTGAGYTINVRIFIDRVLVETVTLNTR